jgi:hypothetical protein
MRTRSVDFKLPWVAVSAREQKRLEAELSQEICLLHQLAALDRRVIARRVDSNDILIEVGPHLCECAAAVACSNPNGVVPAGWRGRNPGGVEA